MRNKQQPVVLNSGEVVSVRPAMLNVHGAALYTAISESKLNQLRGADAQALREARPTAGPKWVVLCGTMVRYRLSDLNEWMNANAESMGVAESFRRGKTTEQP